MNHLVPCSDNEKVDSAGNPLYSLRRIRSHCSSPGGNVNLIGDRGSAGSTLMLTLRLTNCLRNLPAVQKTYRRIPLQHKMILKGRLYR